jgi:O-antigen polymerase
MTNRITLFYILFAIVFLLAPFYSAPNIGGTGLRMPFNISIWLATPWLICLGIFITGFRKKIVLPESWKGIIYFVSILVLVGASNNSEPISWLFRIGTILGGILFLITLFQIRLSKKQIEVTLLLLLIAIFSHGIIGVLQSTLPTYLPAWAPTSIQGKAYGMFQQVNIQASYMATGIAITIYFVSRPSFESNTLSLKLFLIANIAVFSYVIFSTGSRVGLLGAILSTIILTVTRRKQLAKHKTFIFILLVAVNVSAWSAAEGISYSLDKTVHLTQGKAARLSMYKIGVELVVQKPFTGHGTGNFQKVWAQQSADFKKRFPEAVLPDAKMTTHPHNEILYWLIEGGAITILGIMLMLIALGRSLYFCGFSRGGAYLSMLLPISLHTQLEMPFYGSSIHWLTWLFLIFLPMQHRTITYCVTLSRQATLMLYASCISIALLVSNFMMHTFKAQSDVFRFLFTKSEAPYLQIAMNNLYFKPLAVELAMRSKLYKGINDENDQYVREFITWVSEDRKNIVSLLIYEDLAKSYEYLHYKLLDCNPIETAKETYPDSELLSYSLNKCIQMKSTENQ